MNDTIAYLNSNDGTGLLGLGEESRFVLSNLDAFERIQTYLDDNKGKFIFTCLSYDLKEETIGVPSGNGDFLNFPKAIFWCPAIVVKIKNDALNSVEYGELNDDWKEQIGAFFAKKGSNTNWNARIKARTSKESYIANVEKLLEEIQFGNIYEVNYCQEFYDDNFKIEDAEAAYFKLNTITEAPFSAYLAFDEFKVLSGSPERFIQKKENKILSQPIKGTSKRGRNPKEDELLKKALSVNLKERSENVMIVDLVRNDLSKIAKKASVQVDELFGVYSFKTVHQMISTISCAVKPEVDFTQILNATFPMGSMTGAPKKSAVELIEKHENFCRGLYSGSIGYIAPNGDFDFNVVIRSLIYNEEKKYLSCAVGGAITIQSTPEAEYEECKVKIKTILDQMHA